MTDDTAFTEYFTSEHIRIAGDYFNPLFLACDVAKRIGDKNHNAILKNYPPNYVVKQYCKDYPNFPNGVNFLTEKGLYRYLLKSERPDAAPFQEWVYDQLCVIRKKLITNAQLEAKIASDDLAVANDIIDAISMGLYDDTRIDSCPRGLSEYYIGKFIVQYRNLCSIDKKITRDDLPEDLAEGLYLIACQMYQGDQAEFYIIVEEVLRDHYEI